MGEVFGLLQEISDSYLIFDGEFEFKKKEKSIRA
jgi:hypothetical protein